MKKILCLFLALLLCLGLMPASGMAESRQTRDVWAEIDALEQKQLAAQPGAAGEEDLLDQVEALVLSQADTVPGSVCRRDGALLWKTADGLACGYDPAIRAQIRKDGAAAKTEPAGAKQFAAALQGEQEDAVLLAGDSGSRDVAVLIPWESFPIEPYYRGVQLAQAMGGTCRGYVGKEATIEVLGEALTSCRIVIINTHGSPGTITLTTGEGITAEDMEDYHAVFAEDHWSVDAQAILNHVQSPIKTEFLMLACCHGMSQESMSCDMRDAGVEVVFGWSNSVQNITDRLFIRFMTDGLLRGMTMGEAASGAKEEFARYILRNLDFLTEDERSTLTALGAMPWDYFGGDALTVEKARAAQSAFPIVVSDQDPYPGSDHKDEVQTVKCTWKLPMGESADEDRKAWGRIGMPFRFFYPDAKGISLLDGSLPPGVAIETIWLDSHKEDTLYAPALSGIPTKAGYYSARLKVTLENGTTRIRRIAVLIAQSDIGQSQQEISAQAGLEQTLYVYNGYSGDVFHASMLSGEIPPGMTLLSDGGIPRLSGMPMQPGRFSATFRIVLATGKIIDHTLTVIIPAKSGISQETLTLFLNMQNKVFLNFEGSERVSRMQLISGEMPPGVILSASMSEAPCYSGKPTAAGTYRAAFRVQLMNGSTVTHLVTAIAADEAPFLPSYAMDLSRRETVIPQKDMNTWVTRSLTCADQAQQIRMQKESSGAIRLDLDKSGSWDIAADPPKNGTVVFRQLETSSLTGNDRTLKLNADAVARAEALWASDHSAWYAKEIAFHLNDEYDLYVAGVRVGSRNQEDILGNGVFSFDGVNALFIHGSFDYTGGQPLIRSEIDGLTIRTDADSFLSCWGDCIHTTGSLSLTGTGQLTLQSGEGSGIVCEKALLDIFNTAVMIQAKQKGITGTGSGSVHARIRRASVAIRSGEGAMDGFWSIGMESCMVSKPTRGGKGAIGGYACLVDSDGQLLTEAQITAYQEAYGLTIDGVPVTDRNRSDVLKDGTFSFDGDHTLLIRKSYEDATDVLVDSRIDGLVISAAPNIVLRTSARICMRFTANTEMTGGPLTVISSGKMLSRGISLQNGSRLFINGMDLTVQGARWGIDGSSEEGECALEIRASDVNVSALATAIRIPGGLTLDRCILTEPEGGAFSETDGIIHDAGGNAAGEVSIRSTAPAISVSGEALSYSVWLAGSERKACFLAAWYDDAGRMLGLSAIKGVDQDGFKTGTIPVQEGQAEYRLFVLDEETSSPLIPVLKAVE